MGRSTGASAITRRQLLAGIGAVGVATAVSACGGNKSGGDPTAGPTSTAAAGEPTRGGTLRFGYTGATATDSLDVQTGLNDFELAMGYQMHATLGRINDAGDFENVLADEVDESPTEIVVRLKEGLEFHDGRPVTANDVLASFRRMVDPNQITGPGSFLTDYDMASSAVVDDRTVRFVITRPNAFALTALGHTAAAIYPDGAFDEANPIGAGAWKLRSFTPGSSVEFERFDNFPTPVLLDGLVMQSFADPTAMANALSGGSVDAIGKIQPTQAQTLGSGFRVQQSDTGGWGGFVLDASRAPFDDPRVREAFKLLVDRPRMIEQLQGGQGQIGNDLFSPTDAVYVGDELEQRALDVDRATSLLRDAGADGLQLDIAVSGLIPNLEVVLAEQVRAGGVTLNVTQVDSTTYFASHYAQDPIYATLWPTLTVSSQVASSLVPGSFYPEGNWQNDQFQSLWTEAQADFDESSRTDKLQEMQRLFYEDGTYLIWGFQVEIDAMAPNVQGGKTDASGWPFGSFDFSTVYFS